jgi:hypothetical protein
LVKGDEMRKELDEIIKEMKKHQEFYELRVLPERTVIRFGTDILNISIYIPIDETGELEIKRYKKMHDKIYGNYYKISNYTNLNDIPNDELRKFYTELQEFINQRDRLYHLFKK